MADREAVYRVLDGFSFDEGGVPYTLRRGDLIDETHPAFKRVKGTIGTPGALLAEASADEVRRQRDRRSVGAARATETATAAPGERRRTTHPSPAKG